MRKNIINEYILNGISEIISKKNMDYLGYIVKFDTIRVDILGKIYKYLCFHNKIKDDSDIKISPYLSLEQRYYIFGLFGLSSIFSIKKIKNEIPFWDDMIKELSEIPELTGDYEKDLILYINFNKKLLEYNSPTRNVMFVFTIVFKKEIMNFNDIYLKKFYK